MPHVLEEDCRCLQFPKLAVCAWMQVQIRVKMLIMPSAGISMMNLPDQAIFLFAHAASALQGRKFVFVFIFPFCKSEPQVIVINILFVMVMFFPFYFSHLRFAIWSRCLMLSGILTATDRTSPLIKSGAI